MLLSFFERKSVSKKVILSPKSIFYEERNSMKHVPRIEDRRILCYFLEN
jgi:hypothetical protein